MTQIYPDFITMHGKISSSYEKAAEENRACWLRSDVPLPLFSGRTKPCSGNFTRVTEATPRAKEAIWPPAFCGEPSRARSSSIRWNGSLNSRQAKVLRERPPKRFEKQRLRPPVSKKNRLRGFPESVLINLYGRVISLAGDLGHP